MNTDLEKVFSPEVLTVLDERMRKIAEETRSETVSEWLDVPRAAEYITSTKHHVREIIARLKAECSEDVYQPNGPGTKPLLIRRASLRDLTNKGRKK